MPRGYDRTEKSGQHEVDFEYGQDFAHHIEAFTLTVCKVLVRCNPAGDRALNRRQAVRLTRLSDPLAAKNCLRPHLMIQAIHELEVAAIAGRQREFVDLFEKARS